MTSPTERVKENITTVTALLIIGLGIIGYTLSLPYFWVIFVIGLLVIVPLIGLLFDADDWEEWNPLSDEFWEDLFGETNSEEDTTRESENEESQEEALTTLRNRYAKGNLSDEQFERKLELLLETESIEDIQDRFEDQSRTRDYVTERE